MEKLVEAKGFFVTMDGLAFAEADGFFSMMGGHKETYLVAPRLCPCPARDVMGMKMYAFLLRSHGVQHDWRF